MAHKSDYYPGRQSRDGDNFFGSEPDNIHVFTGSVIISGSIVVTSGGISPGPHAITHISSGGDEINGDQLDIDFIPVNYLPDTSIPEATTTGHLSAHLAGIDNALSASKTPGGDLTGSTVENATVTGIQGTPVSSVSPSHGQVLVYNSASNEWEPDTLNPVGVYGTQYQFYESSSMFSTTAPTFQQAARYPVSSIPAGTYKIVWMYVWSHDSITSDIEVRVQVDDSLELLYPYHRQEPKDSSNQPNAGATDQRHVACGFATASLGSGSHFVDIDIRTTKAFKESAIHSSRLEIFRIS